VQKQYSLSERPNTLQTIEVTSSLLHGSLAICLTPTELIELTNRTRNKAQVRALRFMGIEHRVRPDGSVAVLRAHLERVLCGEVSARLKKKSEPNWSAI